MASFCSKCGAELSPGAQSCGACGTPALAAVPVPVPVQQVVAPARSGGSALKIILIILAVVIGLGILGMGAVGFFVWRVAHRVHVATSASGNGSNVTIQTPGGTLTAGEGNTYTAEELGTDLYPGATSVKGGMRMSMPSGSMVTGVFVTGDSKDQVLAFYKSKFGSDASIYDSGDGAVLTMKKGDKESVVLTITKGSGDEAGKTQISIVHSTSK